MADPITWPANIRPTSASFYLEHNTVLNVSPLNRAAQAIERPGARWRCQLEFSRRNAVVSGVLDATIARLRGGAREVYIWDFRRPLPSGTLPFEGPVTVGSAAAGAESLVLSGWAPGVLAFRAGDYLADNGYLYQIVHDVAVASDGSLTVVLEPRLRNAVPNGTGAQVVQAPARFRLADNNQGGNSTDAAFRSTYNLSFVESLP